jgi:ClpP class serine protease
MILLEGNIWSIHPLAVASARDAAQKLREATESAKPSKKQRRRQTPKTESGFAGVSESLLFREFAPDEMPLEMINGVAVVTISDLIVPWASYYYCSHPLLQQTFRYIQELRPQGGALLLIDSPGGAVKGSAETIDSLNAMQDAGIRTVAQVKGGAFSAAYKIASQCRGGIYVHRQDEVGSIGTKMVLTDYSEAMTKAGIEVVAITNANATFKTVGEFGLPITEEQREFLADYCEQLFAEFRRCVQDGRKLTDEQFAAVSNGGWWLPEPAMALGLVDGIRTTNETLVAMQPSTRSIFLKEESDMLTAAEQKAADEKAAAEKAAAEKAAAEKAATEKAAADKAAEEKAAAEKAAAEKAAADKAAAEAKSVDVGELQKWVATFGAENGTKWFVEAGCTYTQALERQVELQKKQIETVTTASQASEKLLKEVGEKLGQLDPLNLEKKAAKEEAGGKTAKEGMTLAEIMSERNKK